MSTRSTDRERSEWQHGKKQPHQYPVNNAAAPIQNGAHVIVTSDEKSTAR